MISGSKTVSEQTACMCRLFLDFRFIFSQNYDIWEQDIHMQADLSLHFYLLRGFLNSIWELHSLLTDCMHVQYDLSLSLLALLFWFFGVFRCGTLLFMVILVIYK